MTDPQIVAALTSAVVLERDARQHWQAPDVPAAERDAALSVVRHTTAVIRSLEQWVAVRQPAATT